MIIAPYWADSDIRQMGAVWYRETNNQTLLARARREIRSAFVNNMDFEPTYLFIATWDRVPYFPGRDFNMVRHTNFLPNYTIDDVIKLILIDKHLSMCDDNRPSEVFRYLPLC